VCSKTCFFIRRRTQNDAHLEFPQKQASKHSTLNFLG